MKKFYRRIMLLIMVVIFLLGILFFESTGIGQRIISNPESVRHALAGAGFAAPLMFIMIQALHILFPIIPGQFFTILGGFAFGPLFGAIYSLIGVTLGSLIIFYVTRRFGKKPIEHLLNDLELSHFEYIFKKKGIKGILILRFIPLIPYEIFAIGAGLSKIKTKDFLIITILTDIPFTLIYSIFGDQFALSAFHKEFYITLFLVGCAFIIYLYRNAIKRIAVTELNVLEQPFRQKKGEGRM